MSEARLAFTLGGGAAPAAVLGAAGGGFHDGTSWPVAGLAVWASILNPDGSPTAVAWEVEVVGPGLPSSAPMRFTYPANFSRILLWAAEVPASPGSYGLVARSPAGAVARTFTIASLPTIAAPIGISARADAQGAASATWTAVPGAASYLVTARLRATQAFVMSQWVAGPAASFPAGTFVAGETYDVFVAATDADMVGGTPPTTFAITENGFQPATFVGR